MEIEEWAIREQQLLEKWKSKSSISYKTMFCLNYYPNQNYQEVDELKIKYRRADRTLESFLEKYSNKSIVIDVSESFQEIDEVLFMSLYEKYKNFKLIINFQNKEYLKRVKKCNLPFFFSDFVTTIDQVNGLIKYQPTDMYICQELCFSIDKVSDLLHEKNIKVRVFPNICQSSFSQTPSIKTFFIRPEDIQIYSKFIDIFEIISDEKRQKVLFKIYQREKWLGKIKELIPSFSGELDNKYILSAFGSIRSKCGKRCMYKPKSCSICDRFIQLADTLKQNKIVIKNVKKKS